MTCKLNTDQLAAARHLFDQPHLGFVIDAVIAGNANGDIWADDPFHPQVACLWDRGPRYYLAGRADDNAFSANLKQVVAEHIPGSYLVVYCTSNAWAGKLSGIFHGRPFRERQRCLYRLERLGVPDWQHRTPLGLSVQRIDRKLIRNESLANLDLLKDEILGMWPTIDAFLDSAFGFCAIQAGDKVACWCTAEYVSGGQLGVGIETVREFQHQGAATLTASAFAEHCLSNHIEAHWDSWADNIPSIRVAEKVGFRKVLDYDVYQGQ